MMSLLIIRKPRKNEKLRRNAIDLLSKIMSHEVNPGKTGPPFVLIVAVVELKFDTQYDSKSNPGNNRSSFMLLGGETLRSGSLCRIR